MSKKYNSKKKHAKTNESKHRKTSKHVYSDYSKLDESENYKHNNYDDNQNDDDTDNRSNEQSEHYSENNDNNEYSDNKQYSEEDSEIKPKNDDNKKTVQRLKRKINSWMDYDDKIKQLNAKSKKYKDAKKQQEEFILRVLVKLEEESKVDALKIDVESDNGEARGRVYRHKSQTREPLKENIIKDALMEYFVGNEKKVDQLLKKIDKKRPIKERYYLKRTKGTK